MNQENDKQKSLQQKIENLTATTDESSTAAAILTGSGVASRQLFLSTSVNSSSSAGGGGLFPSVFNDKLVGQYHHLHRQRCNEATTANNKDEAELASNAGEGNDVLSSCSSPLSSMGGPSLTMSDITVIVPADHPSSVAMDIAAADSHLSNEHDIADYIISNIPDDTLKLAETKQEEQETEKPADPPDAEKVFNDQTIEPVEVEPEETNVATSQSEIVSVDDGVKDDVPFDLAIGDFFPSLSPTADQAEQEWCFVSRTKNKKKTSQQHQKEPHEVSPTTNKSPSFKFKHSNSAVDGGGGNNNNQKDQPRRYRQTTKTFVNKGKSALLTNSVFNNASAAHSNTTRKVRGRFSSDSSNEQKRKPAQAVPATAPVSSPSLNQNPWKKFQQPPPAATSNDFTSDNSVVYDNKNSPWIIHQHQVYAGHVLRTAQSGLTTSLRPPQNIYNQHQPLFIDLSEKNYPKLEISMSANSEVPEPSQLSSEMEQLVVSGTPAAGAVEPPAALPTNNVQDEQNTTTSAPTAAPVEVTAPAITPARDPVTLLRNLRKQVEFYFSKENLARDNYLYSQMDTDGYVPLYVISRFNAMQLIANDNVEMPTLIEALRDSTLLQLDEDGMRVRANFNRFIVILREIPENTAVQDIMNLFEVPGCPKCESCEFAANSNWYATFQNEEDARTAHSLLVASGRTFLGASIKARVKIRSHTLSTYNIKPGAATNANVAANLNRANPQDAGAPQMPAQVAPLDFTAPQVYIPIPPTSHPTSANAAYLTRVNIPQQAVASSWGPGNTNVTTSPSSTSTASGQPQQPQQPAQGPAATATAAGVAGAANPQMTPPGAQQPTLYVPVAYHPRFDSALVAAPYQPFYQAPFKLPPNPQQQQQQQSPTPSSRSAQQFPTSSSNQHRGSNYSNRKTAAAASTFNMAANTNTNSYYLSNDPTPAVSLGPHPQLFRQQFVPNSPENLLLIQTPSSNHPQAHHFSNMAAAPGTTTGAQQSGNQHNSAGPIPRLNVGTGNQRSNNFSRQGPHHQNHPNNSSGRNKHMNHSRPYNNNHHQQQHHHHHHSNIPPYHHHQSAAADQLHTNQRFLYKGFYHNAPQPNYPNHQQHYQGGGNQYNGNNYQQQTSAVPSTAGGDTSAYHAAAAAAEYHDNVVHSKKIQHMSQAPVDDKLSQRSHVHVNMPGKSSSQSSNNGGGNGNNNRNGNNGGGNMAMSNQSHYAANGGVSMYERGSNRSQMSQDRKSNYRRRPRKNDDDRSSQQPAAHQHSAAAMSSNHHHHHHHHNHHHPSAASSAPQLSSAAAAASSSSVAAANLQFNLNSDNLFPPLPGAPSVPVNVVTEGKPAAADIVKGKEVSKQVEVLTNVHTVKMSTTTTTTATNSEVASTEVQQEQTSDAAPATTSIDEGGNTIPTPDIKQPVAVEQPSVDATPSSSSTPSTSNTAATTPTSTGEDSALPSAALQPSAGTRQNVEKEQPKAVLHLVRPAAASVSTQQPPQRASQHNKSNRNANASSQMTSSQQKSSWSTEHTAQYSRAVDQQQPTQQQQMTSRKPPRSFTSQNSKKTGPIGGQAKSRPQRGGGGSQQDGSHKSYNKSDNKNNKNRSKTPDHKSSSVESNEVVEVALPPPSQPVQPQPAADTGDKKPTYADIIRMKQNNQQQQQRKEGVQQQQATTPPVVTNGNYSSDSSVADENASKTPTATTPSSESAAVDESKSAAGEPESESAAAATSESEPKQALKQQRSNSVKTPVATTPVLDMAPPIVAGDNGSDKHAAAQKTNDKSAPPPQDLPNGHGGGQNAAGGGSTRGYVESGSRQGGRKYYNYDDRRGGGAAADYRGGGYQGRNNNQGGGGYHRGGRGGGGFRGGQRRPYHQRNNFNSGSATQHNSTGPPVGSGKNDAGPSPVANAPPPAVGAGGNNMVNR